MRCSVTIKKPYILQGNQYAVNVCLTSYSKQVVNNSIISTLGCEMDEIQQLKQESKQWRNDHIQWLADADFWVHQTQQLTALLHKLERSLPEHTAKLDQHVSLIMQHEQNITRYECGLDSRCMPGCDSYVEVQQQREFHDNLRKLHKQMQRYHQQFSEQYKTQMAVFYQQAQMLMQEITQD